MTHEYIGKNTKWRHIECSECVLFDDQLSRVKNKEQKLKLESERQEHWDDQERERDSYDYQVVKVIRTSNLYLIDFYGFEFNLYIYLLF